MGGQVLSFNCDALAQHVLRTGPFVNELRFTSFGACSSTSNNFPETTLFLVHCPMSVPQDIDVAIHLKKQHPSIPVLLTAHRIDVTLVLAALREHLWDFILLPSEIDRLTDTLRRVPRCATYRTSEWQGKVMRYRKRYTATLHLPGVKKGARRPRSRSFINVMARNCPFTVWPRLAICRRIISGDVSKQNMGATYGTTYASTDSRGPWNCSLVGN